MISAYRAVLSVPGALAFSSTGFLARMPIAMYSLGLVILVEATTGSYGVAGAVAGVYGVTSAFAGILVARLFDRYGQGRLLRLVAVAQSCAIAALVAAAVLHAPYPVLFAAAFLAGVPTPSIGSLVRARWSYVVHGPALHTAYSLESVLDEAIFILGPLLVTVLATSVVPAAGLLLGAVFTVTGGLLLAAQRRTEPPPSDPATSAVRGAWRLPGVVALTAALAGTGWVFGSVEVAVVAFTEERGRPALAGGLLALMALASMVAGLAYGAVSWRGRAERRLLVAVAVFAAGTLLLPPAGTIPLLAAAVVATGIGISPVLITVFALVERLVPPARLTEGLTLVTTGLSLAYAGAAALTGAVVEAAGARAGFLVTTASGALTLGVTALAARSLGRQLSPARF